MSVLRNTRLAASARQIYGIRHGEALHNVVATTYGPNVYEQFEDTTLTSNGMQQAMEADAPLVDVVLVSPLLRTLQTSTLMYPDTPTLALECLKEIPQNTELCNRRSSLSLLEQLFPHVCWSMIPSEEQEWPEKLSNKLRINQLDMFLTSIPREKRVALVTHSSWLNYYMTETTNAESELKHCFPYILETIY